MATEASRPVVIFLARNLVVGGAERTYLSYVNRAVGYRPVAALLDAEGGLLDELDPLVPMHEIAGGESRSPLRRWIGGTLAGRFLQLLVHAYRLRRLARETGATTISSFLMRSHLVALLAKAISRGRLRVVLNVHEHPSSSAEYLYPRALDRFLMRTITRRFFPGADRIVAVAHAVRDDLVETFGIASEKVVVAFNPLDAVAIRERARERPSYPGGAAPDGPRLVALGRLVPLKGYAYLIEAIALLPVSLDVSLVVIGDGEDRARLERLARNLEIEDRVVFFGWRRNPWKYLDGAALMVLPSLTEAFPLVIGEALALRVPVVAADSGPGVRELLEDGRLGVLVPPADPPALAGAIERLLSNPGIGADLVAGAWSRLSAFDPAVAIPRYERAVLGLPGDPVDSTVAATDDALDAPSAAG